MSRYSTCLPFVFTGSFTLWFVSVVVGVGVEGFWGVSSVSMDSTTSSITSSVVSISDDRSCLVIGKRKKIENYFSIQCSINVVLKWLSCCFQFCYINAIYHNVSMSTSAFFGTFFLYFSFFASLTFLSTMALPRRILHSISTCVLKMLLYWKVYRYFHNLLNVYLFSLRWFFKFMMF